jgi:hypothetical protein
LAGVASRSENPAGHCRPGKLVAPRCQRARWLAHRSVPDQACRSGSAGSAASRRSSPAACGANHAINPMLATATNICAKYPSWSSPFGIALAPASRVRCGAARRFRAPVLSPTLRDTQRYQPCNSTTATLVRKHSHPATGMRRRAGLTPWQPSRVPSALSSGHHFGPGSSAHSLLWV